MSKEPVKSATYIVAVSGGVDSVVLLDILVRQIADAPRRLHVAHFDHGIRPDSADDRQFVSGLAQGYGLPFSYGEGRLGPGASEAAARDARYEFLRKVRSDNGADFIVTAHHEDDMLETAVLNLLRGTGRKGLGGLRSHGDLYRPLLVTPKAHVVAYAERQGLQWREDSTNASDDYLRNYIRHTIMPRFDARARLRLRQLVEDTQQANTQIDSLLAEQLHLQPAGDMLDRQWFTLLPHAVAKEIMATWLRRLGIAGFDRRLIERLVVAAKTLAPGKQADINGRYVLLARREHVIVVPRSR